MHNSTSPIYAILQNVRYTVLFNPPKVCSQHCQSIKMYFIVHKTTVHQVEILVTSKIPVHQEAIGGQVVPTTPAIARQ